MGISHSDYLAMLARTQPKRPPGPLTAAEKRYELEATLHDEILSECLRRGWITLHSRMDRATCRMVGEPDFIILAPGRVLLIEVKRAKGKRTKEQEAFAAWAEKLGHHVHDVRCIERFREIIQQQNQ